MDETRLFFGFEVEAPWRKKQPNARLIKPIYRHMTLAFLPKASLDELKRLQGEFPLPQLPYGPCGLLDELIFLPPKRPRVVAAHPKLFHSYTHVAHYQEILTQWLIDHGFSPAHPDRPWLPHVTIGRAPFDPKAWREDFLPLPFISRHMILYQSLGHSTYEKLWKHKLTPPFEEIHHTADIAYRVRAKSYPELFLNALAALAFRAPSLVTYRVDEKINGLIDVVQLLNRLITQMDIKEGCPLKSVSHQGEVEESEGQLVWEMVCAV